MTFFIPDHGISGPEMAVEEIWQDDDVKVAFEMAEAIYEEEVSCFFNNSPGFYDSTPKEQRAIYVLARALQAYAKAYSASKQSDYKGPVCIQSEQ